MRVAFTVLGEPQGKGRPKFARKGSYVSVRTPEKTKEYESTIQAAFLEKYGSLKFPEESLLDLRVVAYYGIPKSASQKKRKDMVERNIRPTKKPDVDNVFEGGGRCLEWCGVWR